MPVMGSLGLMGLAGEGSGFTSWQNSGLVPTSNYCVRSIDSLKNLCAQQKWECMKNVKISRETTSQIVDQHNKL